MKIKDKKLSEETNDSSGIEPKTIIKIMVGILCLGLFIVLSKIVINQMNNLEKQITTKKYYELILNNGQIVQDSMLYFNKRYIRDSISYPEASIQSIKEIKNPNVKTK